MLKKRKSQVTGRHVVVMIAIFLALLIAVLVITGNLKGFMTYYLGKIWTWT